MDIEWSPSEFVAVVNQTFGYAYPHATIVGELANFRVSKNRWVYFDLKDEDAALRFFGTVYQLPGPLEDGMMVAVQGSPRLHPQFGFSVNVARMRPVGEGAIKKAAGLLEAKLRAEGLFDAERKRALPYPPRRVALITSAESAAYRDFMKVLAARWAGVEIVLLDVQVQGEPAADQIVAAIEQCNALAEPPEVLVLTRGGGSAEDLQAFSAERVVRAVAASRIPTLAAVGHERDVSLAELAADVRASTPSNAAELLVPDRRAAARHIAAQRQQLTQAARAVVRQADARLAQTRARFSREVRHVFDQAGQRLALRRQVLAAFDPQAVLRRGYAVVRSGGVVLTGGRSIGQDDVLQIVMRDAEITARATRLKVLPPVRPTRSSN